jgi:hypothetical protein
VTEPGSPERAAGACRCWPRVQPHLESEDESVIEVVQLTTGSPVPQARHGELRAGGDGSRGRLPQPDRLGRPPGPARAGRPRAAVRRTRRLRRDRVLRRVDLRTALAKPRPARPWSAAKGGRPGELARRSGTGGGSRSPIASTRNGPSILRRAAAAASRATQAMGMFALTVAATEGDPTVAVDARYDRRQGGSFRPGGASCTRARRRGAVSRWCRSPRSA